MANPVPEGFGTVTPHLVIEKCDQAIEFYKKAFGAEEICRMPGPDGKTLMHAELKIGNSMLMMAEAMPEYGMKGAQALGGSPVVVHLYVSDVDNFIDKAVKAGAELTMPPMDMFWGDRYGKLKDPYGHNWSVATHTKDMTPEEIAKAGVEFMKNMPGGCGD
jgi:uncharacterized glyoxalase superfamily protein PhnB